ncbi:MAG TPA: hypothetical protein PKE15_00675 [Ottowia sp.]|nr:hypothetical protein [Ottowia sp.]
MRKFGLRKNSNEWENFIPFNGKTKKQSLLDECENLGISPYIDDESETSSGVYAQLRAVASEAELERRLIAKRAERKAVQSNLIAAAGLIVSLVSLVVAVYAIK